MSALPVRGGYARTFGEKMNRPHRNPLALIRAIFEASRSVILMWVCIQIVLLIIAIIVGLIGWTAHGFFHGLLYAMVSFGIGEAMAAVIIEMTWELPERGSSTTRLPSDQEELDALRAELDPKAEQDITPDR